jgi:hypothetical protein
MNQPILNKTIIVNDKMQTNYIYNRTEKIGNLDMMFTPDLTPNQMLQMGVFEGKYMNDCFEEFKGTDLFNNAKLSDVPDPLINFYRVKSRLPLSYWKDLGWIYWEDPRGWFQWYCRYYYGRRCPDDDRQIKRWRSFKARVTSQLINNCSNQNCRPVQRQSLIQWAIDARKL